MSDGFEWNENKAAENYAKHGISFEMATKVFKDPFAIERLDDREGYGEDRFILTGSAEGAVLTSSTPRGTTASGLSRRDTQQV